MELKELLTRGKQMGASDIFVIPGAPVTAKVKGNVFPIEEGNQLPPSTELLVRAAYNMTGRDFELLSKNGDDDFSFSVSEVGRFRCNAYRQRGTYAMTLRILSFELPDPKAMHIPDAVMQLTDFRSGMVLVTGPAGSGKSTTLACMVDKINNTRSGHIITIEDPIEFIYKHKKSLVSQREVPGDAPNFSRALRAALRQAPDVILLGEMRDSDSIRTAITAAETGHLLLSSLHTVGASKTVDRILDMFPSEQQQQQIRMQLSMILRAVVSQRLIPTLDGTLTPVFEVMRITPALQSMIREGRTHQMDNVIASANDGSLSMDAELARLVKEKRISAETALMYAIAPDALKKRI